MKRPRDYRCEYRTDAEHRALAGALHARPATVLLSGYPSTLYDDPYAGWHRVERHVVVDGTHTLGGTNRRATEVVWSNRPRAAQLRLPDPIAELEVP